MFNYELFFLHGFSWRNREILNKAVLTPQEYDDFFWKNGKKSKNLLGVFPQVSKSLAKIIFFRKKHFLWKKWVQSLKNRTS